MNLFDFYKLILKYLGTEPDEHGYISTVLEETRKPVTIDGNPLVLPTHENLRLSSDEVVLFHPLSENILRGESEVIHKMKMIMNIKINYTIGIVAQSLLNLVASPALHGSLSPEQTELLVAVTDADDKTITDFIQLMVNGIKNKPDRIFTNIYLKRGGAIGNDKFGKVGVVTFPLYEELKNVKESKLRVKDKERVIKLLEFMFPDISKPDAYSFGSNSKVAPYLDALMRTGANITSRLNDLIYMFEDHIEKHDVLLFDDKYLDYFDDLAAFNSDVRRIPILSGTEADLVEEYKQPDAPVQQAKPPVKKGKGVTFEEMMAANASLQHAPNPLYQGYPQQPQPPQQPSWAAPQPQYPPQGYPQQQYQPPQQPSWAAPQPQYPQQGYQNQAWPSGPAYLDRPARI